MVCHHFGQVQVSFIRELIHGHKANVCAQISYSAFHFRKPENEQGIFEEVLHGKLDFQSEPWPSISEGAKDLVRRMLVRDPKKRLTAHEVLREFLCSRRVFNECIPVFFSRSRTTVGCSRVTEECHGYLLSGHPWVQVGGLAPDKPLDSAVLSRMKQFSAMNKLKKMALRVSTNCENRSTSVCTFLGFKPYQHLVLSLRHLAYAKDVLQYLTKH